MKTQKVNPVDKSLPNPFLPLFTLELQHQPGEHTYRTNRIDIPRYSNLQKYIGVNLVFCNRPIIRQLRKLNISHCSSLPRFTQLKLKVFYGNVDLPNSFPLIIKIYPNKYCDSVFFSTCKNNRGSINGQFMDNMDNKIVDLVTEYPGQKLPIRQPRNSHWVSSEKVLYHKYLYTVQFDV